MPRLVAAVTHHNLPLLTDGHGSTRGTLTDQLGVLDTPSYADLFTYTAYGQPVNFAMQASCCEMDVNPASGPSP